MRIRSSFIAAALAAATLTAAVLVVPVPPAFAEPGGIVAIVNDKPITQRDITLRITLMKVLGGARPDQLTPRGALQSLVDDQVKLNEANRLKLTPTDADISGRIERVAKSMSMTPAQLLASLKGKGISEQSFRDYMSASTAFSQMIAMKYRGEVSATDAEVDAKFNDIKSKANTQISKIMNDPRMKPVTVYSIMEINLPVEGDDQFLLQGRAVEAQQIMAKMKSCGGAKAAASGVFNVKVGKMLEADAAKMPPQLKQALDKAGKGRAIGPIRSKTGIQLLALCGVRKLTPPKPDFKLPTRDQVKNAVINEKYDTIEESFLKTIRGKVYVEYRDKSFVTD
jgi:peptidyl-prolyl cis-trans isomerase SurA